MCNYKCYSWLILIQYSGARAEAAELQSEAQPELQPIAPPLWSSSGSSKKDSSGLLRLRTNQSKFPAMKIIGYRQKSTYKNCNVKHWLGHWCMHILKPPMDQRQPWGCKNSPSNNSSPAHVKNIFEGLSDCTLYSTQYGWIDFLYANVYWVSCEGSGWWLTNF